MIFFYNAAGMVFLFVPFAYTLLRGIGFISTPTAFDSAFSIGVVLWLVGGIIGGIFLANAQRMWDAKNNMARQERPAAVDNDDEVHKDEN